MALSFKSPVSARDKIAQHRRRPIPQAQGPQMIVFATEVHVSDFTGREVTEFLCRCTDAEYQSWWPGTHLRFHTARGEAGVLGAVVYMDEYVGAYRVRGHAVLRDHRPGERLLVQMVWQRIPLPVFVDILLRDDPAGVTIRHEVRIGFAGIGALLDPIFGLGHGPDFAAALDAHVREEFPRLRDMLQARP